jgi:bifunctional DNA-binding transcriptional regulator/antitoxin component of YhaV-PrlF toxin-antitoxin module
MGKNNCKGLPEFTLYGTTTVGERGQVVVPVEARRDLVVEKGDTFLVMAHGGPDKKMLCMIPMSEINNFINHFKGMANKLEEEILKATK